MEWLKIILPNVTTIATIIILVVKLVEYIRKAIRSENWSEVLNILMGYMDKAEQKFDNGADRKEWVLSMMEVSANTINFDIDIDKISKLIDALCKMSKRVNVPMKVGV